MGNARRSSACARFCSCLAQGRRSSREIAGPTLGPCHCPVNMPLRLFNISYEDLDLYGTISKFEDLKMHFRSLGT